MIQVFVLLVIFGASDAQSTFRASGVPCYLQPSADSCHYRLKPDSDNCSIAGEREILSKKIEVVNRTLVSLEQQLIRLGVIPPDNACSKLPPVENGGVIYDDLNLAPGATGRYTCFEGYTLVSDESGRYKFTCTEDGIWDGSVTTVPVKCQLSSEKCDPLENIVNGTITYINNDSSNTLVGDMVVYTCLPGHKLDGPSERFCLRSGNWSGEDPLCVLNEDIHSGGLKMGPHKNLSSIIGTSAGSAAVVVLVLIAIAVIASIAICRKRKLKSRRSKELQSLNDYVLFDDVQNSNLEESIENVFGDSFEGNMKLESSHVALREDLIKKPQISSKMPSLQVIKKTAAAAVAVGKEKFSKNPHQTRQAMVQGDDEDCL